MKHLLLSLLCMATAVFAVGQVNPSSPSKGEQAAEETILVPHERPPASPEEVPPAPESVSIGNAGSADAQIQERTARKEAFYNFLLKRIPHRLTKALPAKVAKDPSETSWGAVLYVLLVILLVLLIISVLDVLWSPYLGFVFGVILLVLLLLWLLGAI